MAARRAGGVNAIDVEAGFQMAEPSATRGWIPTITVAGFMGFEKSTEMVVATATDTSASAGIVPTMVGGWLAPSPTGPSWLRSVTASLERSVGVSREISPVASDASPCLPPSVPLDGSVVVSAPVEASFPGVVASRPGSRKVRSGVPHPSTAVESTRKVTPRARISRAAAQWLIKSLLVSFYPLGSSRTLPTRRRRA